MASGSEASIPLPDEVGSIVRLLVKKLCNGGHVEGDRSSGVIGHLQLFRHVDGETAGLEGRTGGGTRLVGVGTIQDKTMVGERVNVGGIGCCRDGGRG